MAIAAVGLASIRAVLVRVWNGESQLIVLPVLAGAISGAGFGLGLAIWNRGSWRLRNLSGWPWTIASTLGGTGLGAAAGAQSTARVDLSVIAATPFIVIGTALIVVANRRRQLRLEASRPTEPSAIEPRESRMTPYELERPILADEPL